MKKLYKELLQRQRFLESLEFSQEVLGMQKELNLMIERVEKLLISVAVKQRKLLLSECVEHWDKPYYCKSELHRCKKCS
jgi:hypothetical protein